MLLKIRQQMKEKNYNNSIEDFINNAHKIIKEQKQNNYPKDIRGLFKRLGID